MAAWTVTARRGAKVERERRDTLEAALARLAERGGQLQDEAEAKPLLAYDALRRTLTG